MSARPVAHTLPLAQRPLAPDPPHTCDGGGGGWGQGAEREGGAETDGRTKRRGAAARSRCGAS